MYATDLLSWLGNQNVPDSVRKIVIMDCCHAGAFIPVLNNSSLKNIAVFAACSADAAFTDIPGPFYPFTYLTSPFADALIDGLTIDANGIMAADLDADGVLSLTDLGNYLKKQRLDSKYASFIGIPSFLEDEGMAPFSTSSVVFGNSADFQDGLNILPGKPTYPALTTVYQGSFDNLTNGSLNATPGNATQDYFYYLGANGTNSQVESTNALSGGALQQLSPVSVPEGSQTIARRNIGTLSLSTNALILLSVDFYGDSSDLSLTNSYEANLGVVQAGVGDVARLTINGGSATSKSQTGLNLLLSQFDGNMSNIQFSVAVGTNLAWDQWHSVNLAADYSTLTYVSVSVDGVMQDLNGISLPRIITNGFPILPTGIDSFDVEIIAHRLLGQASTDKVIWDNLLLRTGPAMVPSPFATNGHIAPTIVQDVTNQMFTPGDNFTFSIAASGVYPLYYQWQFNGTNIVGATNYSLTLANIQMTNAGTYTVIVGNHYGSVTSSIATLTAHPPVYSLIDLGVLPSPYTNFLFPAGISTNGQLALDGYDDNGVQHAFVYTQGQMIDLGTIQGYSYGTFAMAMNSSGWIVGRSYDSNDNGHAFSYKYGQMNDLGSLLLPPCNVDSTATGINDNGEITGFSYDVANNPIAFILSNGTITNLGQSGHDAVFPTGINSNGIMTGTAFDQGNAGFAYVGTDASASLIATLSPFNFSGGGLAINNYGWVAITGSDSNNISRAFLYSNGVTTDVGCLAAPYNYHSFAFGINNNGDLTGVSSTSDNHGHAFLFTGGELFDLNNSIDSRLNWRLIEATAINDLGQIAGYGKINEASQEHIYVLNPMTQPVLSNLVVGNGNLSVLVSKIFPLQTIILQGSSDLINWNTIQTKVAGDSKMSFTNTLSPTFLHQFFRVVVH